MSETITHLMVPADRQERSVCLGPDGAAAHVTRMLRLVSGRWKLPILFRLFAAPSMRTLELKRDMPGVSQKMLTQHLRELEADGLIERRDFGERVPHVEYALTPAGGRLIPVLLAAREFSEHHTASRLPAQPQASAYRHNS